MMNNIFPSQIFKDRQKHDSKGFSFFNIFISLFFILTIFFVASCEFDNDLREIKAEELKKMMDQKVPFLLVDTRSEYEYREVRIPGAVNIPQQQFKHLDELLPKDKAFPIVFYCSGSS
jgi:hypothetical protein